MRQSKNKLSYIPKFERKKTTERPFRNDPFYKSKRWVNKRKNALRDHPLCVYCLPSKSSGARTLDHLRPRRLYPELEYEDTNLIPVCDKCHARKTGYESNIRTIKEWERRMKGYVVKVNDVYLKNIS